MPRTVRDARLETRTARQRLRSRHEPYWKSIDGGRHIGYRKGPKKRSWLARYRTDNGTYLKKVLKGTPDDLQDADGRAILTFSQAQHIARDWFASRDMASFDDADVARGPYTVALAMAEYLQWYAANNKPSGLRQATYAVNAHILPKLGEDEVAQLTTSKIRRWHQDIAATPPRLRTRPGETQKYREMEEEPEVRRKRKASANRILTVLKAGLNYAIQEGKVSTDEGWRYAKSFKDVDSARSRYLKSAQCLRLIDACEPDFRNLVLAALLTGCRYGELTSMKVGDFDPNASGSVLLPHTKNGKSRHVPLNEEGLKFFVRISDRRDVEERMFLRADGKPWRDYQQRRRLASAAGRASLKNVSFHVLRHTYGSSLAMQDVPMAVIGAALGHADTRMTQKHYAHLSPNYIADTVRANLPSLGYDPTR